MSGTPNWDESLHPRVPAGSPDGGQFTAGDGPSWGPDSPIWQQNPEWMEQSVIAEHVYLMDVDDELVNDPKEGEKKIIDQFAKQHPEIKEQIMEVKERLATVVGTERPISEGGLKNEDGTWSADREQLHLNCLQKAVAAKMDDAASAEPTISVLGGRGGSGKSALTREGGPVQTEHTVKIDNDEFKMMLGDPANWPGGEAAHSDWPKYEGWNAMQFHEEATELVSASLALAREAHDNVVLDVTLNSASTPLKVMSMFGTEGYNIDGYFVHTAPQEAAVRALKRFSGEGSHGGRYVAPSYVLGSKSNEKNFDLVKGRMRHWVLYDNMGSKMEKISEGWNEALHPRAEAGTPQGGQFVSK